MSSGGLAVVTVAQVVEKPMAVNVRGVGNAEASSTVDVRSQVSGPLLQVAFTEGEDVKAGQLLFVIDPQTFEATLRQAEATQARDAAQAKGAAAILARADDLLARGLMSKSEHDAGATQAAATQAAVQADAAVVENARLQLQFTKILAPVSGRTGALLVHQGALVRANDTSPPVGLNQVTPVFVSFAVPAKLLTQLRQEQARGGLAVATVPSDGSKPETGRVTFIDNAVDQTTDTVRLKATFPNVNRTLWPGAFVDVSLRLSLNPRAIVVPSAAVQVGQSGQYIYVVGEGQTVDTKPVKVAWTEGEESVIQSGVKPGETVVTDGQLRLTPGARVTIRGAENQPRGRQ